MTVSPLVITRSPRIKVNSPSVSPHIRSTPPTRTVWLPVFSSPQTTAVVKREKTHTAVYKIYLLHLFIIPNPPLRPIRNVPLYPSTGESPPGRDIPRFFPRQLLLRKQGVPSVNFLPFAGHKFAGRHFRRPPAAGR